MKSLLVRTADLATGASRGVADIRLCDGHIETVAGNLDPRADETVVDTSRQWLLPGMIDDQVQFHGYGLEHKAAEQALAGLPLVQFALQSVPEQAFASTIPLDRIAQCRTHAPAELPQIKVRGYMRGGYYADLVLVDSNQPHIVARIEEQAHCLRLGSNR
ncbi:MAG: hypothetical protein JNN30_10800 [Rhodanobacteraceae bacterium]|nr:hypothetical protein [Rhodanobacteraceae bacterium]